MHNRSALRITLRQAQDGAQSLHQNRVNCPSMQKKAQRHARLQRHQARLWRLIMRYRQADTQFTAWRVGVVLVTLVLAQLAYTFVAPRAVWLPFAVGTFIFLWLVRRHQMLRKLQRRALIMHDLTGEQIARMTLDWDGMPEGLAISAENRTPLETDFDLIGSRSLHRLLDSAETSGGSSLLRRWLIAGVADETTIATRQQLVAELRERRGLRNRLALNVRQLTGGYGDWSADNLQHWLAQHEDDDLARWLWPLIGLALANIVLFALSQLLAWPPLWQATLTLYIIGMVILNRRTASTFQQASQIRDGLEQILSIFGILENYNYRDAVQLKVLCQPFWDGDNRPKQHLTRVVRILASIGITQGNPFIALFANLLFPFNLFLTVALDKAKAKLTDQLPIWLNRWFELEATAALATFAWLNPHYNFPQISTASPLFIITDAGHPLIADTEKVCNDFSVSNSGDLAIITGSNMSGKSTFLRTIGINTVLAFAGSVVDARHFAVRPMQLYSCIKVSDSVMDGFSYFYAEVRRLRGLLDVLEAGGELPVLYFIDEIFRGTNNRERLIGSRSLVQAMAGANGLGFISTHDLELVQLANKNPHIRNFHFREQIVDGQMVFDYTLRDGPSPTTNALKIMRLAGLPIDKFD